MAVEDSPLQRRLRLRQGPRPRRRLAVHLPAARAPTAPGAPGSTPAPARSSSSCDVNHYAQVTRRRQDPRRPHATCRCPSPTCPRAASPTRRASTASAGGTVTSTLAGQYVRVLDNCGAISLPPTPRGDIAFGTSAGTDCTTPGSAARATPTPPRTQFYHVNRAKEQARGWLPTNTWLNAQLTANVNINPTCNAFWNGSTVNFYRSGGGCGNTGEIEGVSLHEYGHGLDSNDGNGSSPDNGTGETYGDFTAALATHTSCVGPGFLTSNCGGYGDACTSCTGVRDIDWAKHASNTPHTVANFTQPRCPTSRSPTAAPAAARATASPTSPPRPCGTSPTATCRAPAPARPGPSSTASGISRARRPRRPSPAPRAAPGPRTAATPARSGRPCAPSTTTTATWPTARRTAAALFAAFNRHGIACTTDPGANVTFAGCAPPAVPTLTLDRRQQPGHGQPGPSSHRASTTSTATSSAATPASSRSPTTSPAPRSPTPAWPTASPTTTRWSPTRAATRPAPRRPRTCQSVTPARGALHAARGPHRA